MSKKKKIKGENNGKEGLNQTIKRCKFILDACMGSCGSSFEIVWEKMLPPFGFCKYYLLEDSATLLKKCSPECPVVKYRGNICFKDKSYSGFWKANTEDEGTPYAMEILVWLFQLKHGVFDE